MGIISAVTGILYVILSGKGKLSAYFFGLVNCVLYSIISYNSKLYGETMLNVAYYIPMHFVGFFLWRKNMNPDTHEVRKRSMRKRMRALTTVLIAIVTCIYGIFLKNLGDAMPYIDSFTTVVSVFAMIAAVGMFSEQWWMWLAVNIVSVYMWWESYLKGSGNLATLLMWIVYLISGIIMLIKWEKEAKRLKN